MDKVIETKSQMIMRIAELSEVNERLQAEYDDLHLTYAGCKTANTGLQELNQKLEQENEELKIGIEKCLENAGIECDDEEQALRTLPIIGSSLYKLQAENKTLERTSNELRKRYSEDTTKLSAELQRYKDMEQKGLEEFKDVGGCWGCGIQETLNQAWKDLKEYREKYENVLKLAKENADSNEYCLQELEQENERLKEEVEHYRKEAYRLADGLNKTENLAFIYKQALQEIREIAEKMYNTNDEDTERDLYIELQAKINEVIGAEE